MDPAMIKNTQERRHFRIDDEVEFAYYLKKSGMDNSHDKELFEPDAWEHFHLMKTLCDIDNRSHESMLALQSEHPVIAKALTFTNDKLDALSQHLFNCQNRSRTQVNISVGGLAFPSSQSLETGTMCRMKVVLWPSYYGFLVDAEVVGTRPNKGNNRENMPYIVSTHFLKLAPQIPPQASVKNLFYTIQIYVRKRSSCLNF